jgi:hypothetical protein
MFWPMFKPEDNDMPKLEKPVFHDMDEVRVDWVLA